VPAARSVPRTRGTLRPEQILTGAVLALVCFGVVMVYSSSSATALLGDGDPLGLMTRQALYALLGLGAYALFARMDLATLRRVAPLGLAVSGVLLLVVLVPGVGIEVNGSRRWLGVGSLLQLQPSELAKLALVLWLAGAVARSPARLRRPSGLVPFLAVTAVLALLVLIEPDMGTAALLLVVTASTLIVAGARVVHLAAVGAAAAMVGVAAIAAAPYRRERLIAFLDPWGDPTDAGFQAVQAQVAFGSGGLGGVGLGDGLQKAFYLPEAHTDMILATVGEELGLVGVMAVLAAFGALAVAGYRIALGAGDLHQQLVAAGLTTLMVAQAAINMGAVLGLMPVTGVPLPFVSYGGSSLVVLLAGVGILVNIAHRSQRSERAARRGPVGLADPGADRGGGDRRARDAGARRRRSAAGAGG
jgi:cell division protein FtsW